LDEQPAQLIAEVAKALKVWADALAAEQWRHWMYS
jgi:hypothetical protein